MALTMTEQSGGGVRFALKVVPGARRGRVVGLLGDALKVAVSKPAQEGAANQAVVALLSAALGVPAAQVPVVRGHTSPRKDVLVAGLTAVDVSARLEQLPGV